MDRDVLRKWFTSLEADQQYLLLKFNYDICHSTFQIDKDDYVNKINQEWEQKTKQYKNKIKELELKIHNNYDVKQVVDKLYNDVLVKFTGNKKGIVNEKLIYDIFVEKYPKCDIKTVSSNKGCGDIFINVNGVRFMVECKMQQESILRSDPDRIFQRFKEESKKAIQDNIVDLSIFISTGSKIIPNYGTFETEEIITTRGKSYLIFIADIYNYPERIDAAIELGIQFYNNTLEQSDDSSLYSKVLETGERMNKLGKYIYKMECSINQTCETINNMKNELSFIEDDFRMATDNVKQFDKIVNIVLELIEKHGYKGVSAKIIEEEFKHRGIPIRKIRENGGAKRIKTIANKKLSNRNVLNL